MIHGRARGSGLRLDLPQLARRLRLLGFELRFLFVVEAA